MKFVLKPSLEHMTLVQIVISLWDQNDAKDLIIKHSSENLSSKKNWKTIVEKVLEKVSQLSLPQPLKEKVLGLIGPIGLEILMWMEYNYKYLPAYPPAKLFWTPQGTVDGKKTAEAVVRDENLNAVTGYRLACDYCLEDDIIRFWNRLPENLKNYNWHNSPVISFWSDNMKRGGAGHISYKDVFYSSVRNSNKVAAKYFLQKLTPQEREESLEELAIHLEDEGVLCFLLPEMKEEEQKVVLKHNPLDMLVRFLEWPWQSFFIEVVSYISDFVSKVDYDMILTCIIHKIKNGYKDYNYQKLFTEFWKKSCSALKDSLVDENGNSWIVQALFDIKDKENMRLILKDATLKAKAKLTYNEVIGIYLAQSIRRNEWDFLEFFIRECLPSKSEMLKFKVEFEKRLMHSSSKEHFATRKQEWDQLFHFSGDSICEYVKRNIEDGESSSSKRFQNLQLHIPKAGKEVI